MLNMLDILTSDLIEKILDIRTDDFDNQISLLEYKVKTIEDLLKPLSFQYDDEEDFTIINYDYISYSLELSNSLGIFDRIYETNMILINKYNELFTEDDDVEGDDYISEVLNFPTYFDILVEANKSVVITGDYHHIFLEGLNHIPNNKLFEYSGIKPKDNYNYYEFMLGS